MGRNVNPLRQLIQLWTKKHNITNCLKLRVDQTYTYPFYDVHTDVHVTTHTVSSDDSDTVSAVYAPSTRLEKC